jgi:hypothetical protein
LEVQWAIGTIEVTLAAIETETTKIVESIEVVVEMGLGGGGV